MTSFVDNRGRREWMIKTSIACFLILAILTGCAYLAFLKKPSRNIGEEMVQKIREKVDTEDGQIVIHDIRTITAIVDEFGQCQIIIGERTGE